MSPPRPWRHLRTEELHDCRVFRLGYAIAASPATGEQHTFYRIDSPDWVNVVPVTPEGEIVMVRQFRHGARAVTLEIPGGLIDPGEEPSAAAARELLEETGFRGEAPEALGCVNPNPALFGNACYSFVVRGATCVAEIANSATEETAVELVAPARLRALLDGGQIDHALVQVALYRYLLESGGRRG